MPDQPDKRKVILSAHGTQMQVHSDAAEFAVIKMAICSTIGYAENVDRLDSIFVVNADRPKPVHQGVGLITKIGCVFTAGAIVVILTFGLIKIVELIWR
jgi:hypothetical protein